MPEPQQRLLSGRPRSSRVNSRLVDETEFAVPPVVAREEQLAAAGRALAMLSSGQKVFMKASVSMGPLVTPEFKTALLAIGQEPPKVWACCERCGYHLVKWELNHHRGAVQPYRRASDRTTPGWEGLAWQDAANNGKGRVSTSGAAGDGLGTQNYRCRCGRNVPVKGERRLLLYLRAIAKDERTTVI